MIGGLLSNFDTNYRLGQGNTIVIEGDEYDTAYFDKGPKFLHYDPYKTILTSVEFDHADIFKDLDHVTSVFAEFAHRLSTGTTLVAYDDDTNIDQEHQHREHESHPLHHFDIGLGEIVVGNFKSLVFMIGAYKSFDHTHT